MAPRTIAGALLVLAITTTFIPVQGDDFAENALKRHNYFREIHNAPAMELDEKMSWYATEWAIKIAEAGKLKHCKGEECHGFGDNLGIICDTTQGDGIAVVNMWYKSVCQYDFDKGEPYSEFTQMVWKASTRLGIGKARGKWIGYNCTFWVGYYSPRGNAHGEFKQNVDKGSFDHDKFCKKPLGYGFHN